MVAANYNFDIEKSSDFEINFVYNDENGNPVNLTNKSVEFRIWAEDGSFRTLFSSEALAIYDSDGWSITANNSGEIDIKISADITQKFVGDTAVYDLDIKDPQVLLQNVRLSQGTINLISRNTEQELFPSVAISTDPFIEISVTPTGDSNGSTPVPTPTPTEITDFCLPYDCGPIDIFSTVYDGSGLVIEDLSEVTGSVSVNNTGIIANIELAVNGLAHTNPTDLMLLLSPPSGDKILLSANHKIPNFNNNFSFMFSTKADSGRYLHNIENGDLCRIYDKTTVVNYNNENLLSSFDHLIDGSYVTGVWDLIMKDTDPLGSGSIDSWKLIITYDSDIPEATGI